VVVLIQAIDIINIICDLKNSYRLKISLKLRAEGGFLRRIDRVNWMNHRCGWSALAAVFHKT
jgi:hypothetical protein